MTVLTVAAAPERAHAGGSRDEAAGHHVATALHASARGPLQFAALPDPVLKLHVGGPVRGVCDLGRFLYRRGDLDMFPAGVSESCQIEQATVSFLVRLPSGLLCRTAQELGLHTDALALAPRHLFRDPQLEHLVWALEAEHRAGFPRGELYRESLGLALAVHLLHPPEIAWAAMPRGLARGELKRIIDYIECHLHEKLSVARLAALVGLSVSHFGVLFRRSMGVPVHKYVIQRRVEHARVLLLRGELPASQVALEVGFAHQSHLARYMRTLLGTTPAAVRAEALGRVYP